MQHMGQMVIDWLTSEGQGRSVTFQLADVSKLLVCVASICDAGNVSVFMKNGGMLVPEKDMEIKVKPGSPTTDLTTLGQVAADSDGNVFGMFRSYDTQTNSGTARDRIWIVKWDKAGTYQWHRALYQTRATGGYAMNVDAAECTPDGDLLLGISGTEATQGFQGTFFFKGDGSGAGTFNLNTGVDIKYDDSLVLNESAGALPWAASGSSSGGSPQVSYAQASTSSMTPNDRVKTDF